MKTAKITLVFIALSCLALNAKADIIIKGSGGGAINPDGTMVVCPISSDATCATVSKATSLQPGMRDLQLTIEGGNTYTVNVVEVNGKQAPDGSYQGSDLLFQIANQ